MKRIVLALAIVVGGLTMKVGAQSTVSDGIILEASSLTNFGGRIELREKVTITTEDFVLRADAADLFSGVQDRRIEARGGISVSLSPGKVALLDLRRTQLQEVQGRLGPNHPDLRRLLHEIAELDALQGKVAGCTPGEFGLKVELPPAQRPDPRASFISQLNGALREFRCSAL